MVNDVDALERIELLVEGIYCTQPSGFVSFPLCCVALRHEVTFELSVALPS